MFSQTVNKLIFITFYIYANIYIANCLKYVTILLLLKICNEKLENNFYSDKSYKDKDSLL